MYKKILFLSCLIFLLAAGCAKTQPQYNQGSAGVVQSTAALSATPTPTPKLSPTIPSKKPQPTLIVVGGGPAPTNFVEPSISPDVATVHKPPYSQGYVIVTENVAGSTVNNGYVQLLQSATVYDILTISHKVTATSYGSGMGEFVQSIDGITPDSKHFWELYINGKSSNVGASTYVLKDGDIIEWKLSLIGASGD